MVYSWITVKPITPRKSRGLMSKSHYKGLKIDNKILLARRFSKRTREIASGVKNLALVEAEPPNANAKCQVQVEGEIDDRLLISLLSKALRISESEWQGNEMEWQEKERECQKRLVEEKLSANKRGEEELDNIKKCEKAVKQLFGERWNNFLRFCEEWKEEPDVPSGKSDFVGLFPGWGFDYVAKKGSHNYFVEVKTNKARLRKYQRKMLLKAKKYGFVPIIVRPKVLITAKSEDITIDYI